MRNLEINKRRFVALNYLGQEANKDTSGYMTGEATISYSAEMIIMGSISGAKGGAYAEMFGTEIKYDKTIVLTRKEFMHFGLNENSVFFIDKEPEYDKDNMPIYDYKVEKIADTINEVAIAVSKVRH